MAATQIALLIACVVMISIGQLLFKLAGNALQTSGSWFAASVATTVVFAAALYGLATLLWIYLLKEIPLSKAYPFMALSFILVPVGSWLFYGESLSKEYMIGTLTLASGLVIIAHSQ